MSKHTFLALTNDDLGLSSPEILGAVYAPGLVCTSCLKPLAAGIVVDYLGFWGLLDGICANKKRPGKWLTAIRNKRYFLNKTDCDDDAKLSPTLRIYLRGMLVFAQLFPGKVDAQALLEPLRTKNADVTRDQLWEISKWFYFCGKPKDLLARRDLVWQLRLLADLNTLSGDDRAFVTRTLETGRDFDPNQATNNMLIALQHKYCGGLLTFSRKLLEAWPPQHGSITIE